MKCAYCGYHDSKVVDSRVANDCVRRRRQCLHCERRFTTYERMQLDSFVIVKKDGRREGFRRNKLLNGVRVACAKRPVSAEIIERLIDDVEEVLHQMGKIEVASSVLGELVMERLDSLDRISYIRFASVYRNFADIETLKQKVDDLVEHNESNASPLQMPLILD